MKAFHQYRTFSAIRGAMTILASIAIVGVPQATSSMLSLPVRVLAERRPAMAMRADLLLKSAVGSAA